MMVTLVSLGIITVRHMHDTPANIAMSATCTEMITESTMTVVLLFKKVECEIVNG